MRPIIAIHCLAFLLSIVTLWGQLRSVSFQDEAADHVGEIDLRTITLTFDPLSGEYQILLESSPSAPFEGSYLIGINFFNADLETRAIDPSYFHVDAEIKQQDCWSRTFELRGIEPRLKAWSPGNRIVAGGPQPLGLPDGFFILQTGLASFINPTQANELIGDGQISIVENADQFIDAHNPPNAEDDHFEFPEDTIKQQLNVLENDCSPAELHSLLQITAIAEGPSNGSAELLNGELFYTPNSEFFGTDMMGRGISTVSPSDPQLRSAWDQLNLIDSSDQTPLSGQVDLHLEEEPFFDGRFGDVHPFALQRALGGELRSLQSHPLVTIEGVTLAAKRETLASIEPPQTRTITQMFSLAEPDGESEIKVLFQNSVCWLLQHCISCDNANLPPALIDPVPDVLEDQSFSVLLKLENNGECEISGAQIFLDASGVEAQALTLDGRSAPIQFDAVRRRWMSRVGRVGKGSVAARQVEWTLRITDPLVDHLEFTSSANNSDPITIDLPVHVTTFRLRDTLDRGLILQVQGRPGQLFRIERSQDLSSPIRWQRLANRLSTDVRGIAELPVQATSAAAFYRVSLIEF